MEIEHIDEHTIRVKIEQAYLDEMDIDIFELMQDRDRVETFFADVIDEVGLREELNQTDTAVFQVMPTHTGLELYISLDGEEHFNPFAYLAEEGGKEGTEEQEVIVSNELVAFMDKIADENTEKAQSVGPTEEGPKDYRVEHTFEMTNFEQLVRFAYNVHLRDGISFLHEYEGKYYITLIQFTDRTLDEMDSQWEISVAYEYADFSKRPFSFLEEYGHMIFEGNALEELRGRFEEIVE